LTYNNPAMGCVNLSYGFTLVELLLVIALVGVVLFLAVPATRDTLTAGKLKKASRELIGLERKLRVEAVRDQTDYILCIDIPSATYWVITSDMTPERLSEVKEAARQLPTGITILDIVGEKNQKKSAGEVKIKFGKNNLCPPLVIHLAEEENKMTLVVNPFLGITKIYDKYVDVSVDEGLGKDNPGQS
jgi:prepilin-type N-terminal cleavage/methylation domain-containing protein